MCGWSEFFRPNPPPVYGGDHLDARWVDAELKGQPVAHGPGVLGALVHDEGVPAPFDDAAQQFHRHGVLLRMVVGLVDPHLALCERGLGVSQRDVGEEWNGLLLPNDLHALVVEVHRDWLDLVPGAHEVCGLRGGHRGVRDDQRDRLAPVGNVVAQQRLEALDGVTAGHEVARSLQLRLVDAGHHQMDTGHRLGGHGVHLHDSPLADGGDRHCGVRQALG